MKLIHFMAFTALGVCYLVLAIIMFWAFWPYQVLKYDILPLPVVNKNIHPGDDVQVRNKFCKLINVQLTQYATFEDGVVLNLMPMKGNTPVGCYDRVGFYKVPDVFKTGDRIRLHLQLDYQVNPIRTITYHIYSEDFTLATPSAVIKN